MEEDAQMDLRIDADLKARGDAALRAAGISPSAAVGALWKFAANHEDEPQVIAEEIERLGGVPGGVEDVVRRRLDAYGRARVVFVDRMAGLGVLCGGCASQPEASVGELREEAMLERMAERGLL